MPLATNPAFAVYCLTAAVLCLNMLGLWAYSGAVRGKAKITPNKEDRGTVTAEVPEEMARVLRAHRNATDNILPYLVIAFLYVLLGASATMAWVLFGGFTAMRLAHTASYLGQAQPWRSLTFSVGGVLTLVIIAQVIRAAVVII